MINSHRNASTAKPTPPSSNARMISSRTALIVGDLLGSGSCLRELRRVFPIGADSYATRPDGQREPGSGHPLPGHDAPGEGVRRKQRATVVTAEAAVRREPFAGDREPLDDRTVAVDHQHTVFDRGADIEASVDVEAEAVAAAGP